jgi:predicted phosphate transport protein (TIGR00153 family)
MRLSLGSQDSGFYPLFTAAAENIEIAAGRLAELIRAEASTRPEIAAKVKDAETKGDDITHQIMTKVNSTFITPFDREDIYRLASSLDDVIDCIEEAADHIVLYRLGDLPAGMTAQCDVLTRAAKATVAGMSKLVTMSKLQDYTIELNSLEDEADKIYRRLVADLLAPEDGVAAPDVLTVLKLKEVVEILENAADAFESVANTVASIAAKES